MSDVLLAGPVSNLNLGYLSSNQSLSRSMMAAAHLMVPSGQSSSTYQSYTPYKSLYDDSSSNYKDRNVRHQTFMCWPHHAGPLDFDAMADAGWYYSGNGCELKCFSCGIVVKDWKTGEDPIEGHRFRSRNCSFIISKSTASGTSNMRRENVRQPTTVSNCLPQRPLNVSGTTSSASPSNNEEDLQIDGSDTEEDGSFSASEVRYCSEGALGYTSENVNCKSFNISRSQSQEIPQRLKGSAVAGPVDKTALRAENERLKHAVTCRECGREKVQTLFLPCRHLVACEICAEKMLDCITCNQKILGTVRTFLI